MDVTRLSPGETAPEDSDCIKVNKTPSGRYAFTASALAQCDDDDEGVSDGVISSDDYECYDQAEAAGLAWAEGRCVGPIFIETV